MLVVEDSEDDARLILHELRRGGYEPDYERVETSEQMRAALEAGEWDVIFSDYRMPRFQASEALAMASEAGSEAPFIIVSGKVGEDAAVDAIRNGAYDYVMKDNLSRLRTTVDRGLAEIEDRRRAEKELRESEYRFRSLVQNSSDLITVFAPDGTRSYVSPSVERLLGHKQENLIDGGMADLAHPDDLSVVREAVATSLRKPDSEHVLEARLRHADGSWRTFEGIVTNLVSDPAVGGVVINARDVTERKRFEEDLQRRDAILEAVRFAAERFLTEASWEESIQDVLERLGIATEVSRVYIFENHIGEDGELWGSQRHEWVAAGITAQMDNPLMEAIPYRAAGYGRWVDLLGRGELVYGHTQDFPEVEQPELREQDILSIMIVPVSVEGKWWGQIGFDACETEREWTPAEMDALRAAANTLGSAVQRRRIEKDLRDSEARYRAVIEQATDGIYLLDANSKRVLESNPAFQALLGYTTDELLGMEVYDFVAHTRENIDSTIWTTLEQRNRVLGVRKYRRSDGAVVDVESGVGVISYGGREVICTIVRDVTERQRAERELKESEERFKGLAEATFEGIAITRAGKIIETNAAFAEMFGYEPPELIGMSPLDVTAPKSHETVLEARSSGFEEPYEAVSMKKDGTTFDSEIRGKMTTYKGQNVRVTAIRDITERKRNLEELQESKNRITDIFESMTDAFFAVDREWRFTFLNQQAQKVLDVTQEELLGTVIWDSFSEATELKFYSEYHRALETQKPTHFEEFYPPLDTWFEVHAYPSEDGLGVYFRDVTERKKNEETLRESEERFRSAFESAAIGMALVGLDGRWLRVNEPLCYIVGYSERELLELTFQEITHPDDLDADLELVEKMLAGEEIQRYNLEKRYIHKEGHPVWILLSVSLVRDDRDEPLYFIAQVQDITGRKKAEEALTQSENRLRQIIDTEPECVKVLGLDGSLLEMNPAGLAMLEADSLEQVRGRSVYRYITPEHRANFVALTEKVLIGGSGTLEFELVGRKGTRRWLDTHAVPLRDAGGETSGLLAITRDITERKRAESDLRESERLYRTVIEEAAENIFLVDAESARIVESNPASREALGYTEEEFRRMTLYDIVAHDDESIRRNIQLTREKKRHALGQRKYRRRDGSHIDVEVSASTILYAGREALCVVAHDVSERVRAQRMLEQRVGALSRIASSLTLDQPMDSTLNTLAESMVEASAAVACAVILVDESAGTLRLVGSHGLSEDYKAGMHLVYGIQEDSPNRKAIRTRQPMLIGDIRQTILEDPRLAPLHQSVREARWDNAYVVPLISRGRVLGAIDFLYLSQQEPGDDERIFLEAITDQAAVAVENTRLYAEARGKATLEERQRLARELHDSVSQALYGIALGTETARTLLEHNPDRIAEPLDYVMSLAEAGLAEMRALIFELRPESLETEGLVAALEKQTDALRARHQIEVESRLCEEPDVSLEIKEAVYRIVQEAFHNTTKHSRANNLRLEMRCADEAIMFEVSDDGAGFDVTEDFPGHLGLHSMRERASNLGGKVEIRSAPGAGTSIHAVIPFNG
ncbi:MAG: PAS domain S-box protein [Rubrobacteraceae bacterium]